MFRELVNKLSGGQITLILLAMIFVPGTVVAAVSFQPVAIVDPITGKQSYVDNGRRLGVYDPIAGYRNNPWNFVRFLVSNVGNRCEPMQYTVPSGKAFILVSISGFVFSSSSGGGNSGYYIYDGANCSGTLLTTLLATTAAANAGNPVNANLEPGIVVPAGKTVSIYSLNNFGYTILHGYLVPSSAVPAAAASSLGANAAQVAEKMKRR